MTAALRLSLVISCEKPAKASGFSTRCLSCSSSSSGLGPPMVLPKSPQLSFESDEGIKGLDLRWLISRSYGMCSEIEAVIRRKKGRRLAQSLLCFFYTFSFGFQRCYVLLTNPNLRPPIYYLMLFNKRIVAQTVF